MKKLLKKLAGMAVIFHGYNGVDYEAKVVNVDINAKIEYDAVIDGHVKSITAYISDPARLDLPESASS